MSAVDEYFSELIDDFDKDRDVELRDLSNRAIESAAFTEDRVLVHISIVAYSLGKLMDKPHLFKTDEWNKFKKHILEDLRRKKDLEIVLNEIITDVKGFDEGLGNYTRDVIEKARIKQASRAYALGISLKRASELTGASLSSLMDYIGATKIHDRPFTSSKSVRERYNNVKKILGE
jgi:hypothetical protein